MSTNAKKTYTTRKKLDCNSTYVVYLGTCLKCKGQYVGKTSKAFKARHSGHKSEIKENMVDLATIMEVIMAVDME